MNYIIFVFLALFCNKDLVLSANPPTTQTFSSNQILQSPDLYYLYWTATNYDLTFELHVKDAKWLLFGISGPTISDVIVAWMYPDTTGHFSNRILTNSNSNLQMSSYLNSKLSDAFTQDNYTVIKFSRPLKLDCLNPANTFVNIDTGNVNVVFAYGNGVNTNDDSITITNLQTIPINLLQGVTGTLGCISPALAPVFASTPTGYYSNQVDLVEGFYRLYWNYTDTDFTGEIHVKTTNWVSFGLSPNGGMDGSNVIVGWISNGSPNFTERYITGRSVIPTPNQNWKMLAFGQKNEYTYFKFTRKINICDPKSLNIPLASPYVIWAYGSSLPAVGSDINYHGPISRGSQQVNLLGTFQDNDFTVADQEIYNFDVTNVVLPKVDTYYFCKGFKLPTSIDRKKHIYKVEFILPEYNFKNMHHILVYECFPSFNGTPAYTTNECFNNDVKNTYCPTVSIGWAVGGQTVEVYPRDTGYPIGGDQDFKYFFIEVHYNNPEVNIGYIQSMSLRYYTTNTLRKNELGVLTLGTDSSGYGIAIPPKLDSFNLDVYCLNSCTRQKLNTTNITILQAFPHTHLSGIKVSSKLVRNGKDIGYLLNNEHYDFNYQQTYRLNPPVTLTKDDQIITRCVYNTKNKNEFTLGGQTTKQEMCFQFLMYYPRLDDFAFCMSTPYVNDWADFMNDLRNNNQLKIDPVDNQTNYTSVITGLYQMYGQFRNESLITPAISQKFVNFFKTSNVQDICGLFSGSGKSVSRVIPTNNYIEPDLCSTKNPIPSITNLIQSIMSAFSSFSRWLSGLFRF